MEIAQGVLTITGQEKHRRLTKKYWQRVTFDSSYNCGFYMEPGVDELRRPILTMRTVNTILRRGDDPVAILLRGKACSRGKYLDFELLPAVSTSITGLEEVCFLIGELAKHAGSRANIAVPEIIPNNNGKNQLSLPVRRFNPDNLFAQK